MCLPEGYWVDDASCSFPSSSANSTNQTFFGDSTYYGEGGDGSGSGLDDDVGESLFGGNETTVCFNSTFLFEGVCVDDCPPNHIAENGECVDITRSCQARVCSGNVTGIELVQANATFLSGAYFGTGASHQGQSRPSDRDNAPLIMRLTATVGSIYVVDTQMLVLQSERVGTNSTYNNSTLTPPTGRRNLAPQLSDEISAELNPLLTDLSEFDDTLFRIRLETFEPDTLWLGASKEVFIEFEPGYLNAFSATLLRPKDSAVTGRLYPGFCPYSLPVNDEKKRLSRAGEVSQLLRDGIATFNDSPFRRMGHKISSSTTRIYTLRPDGVNYAKRDLTFSTNKILTAAIILSLVIALIFGIAAAFGLQTIHSLLIQKFEEFVKENKKALNFQKMQARRDNGEEVEGVEAEEEAQKTELGGTGANELDATANANATAHQNAKQAHATPNNQYQLVDQLLKIYQKSKIDSLAEFSNLYFMKEWPQFSDPKYESMRELFGVELDTESVLLSVFESDYRRYCTKSDLIVKQISGPQHISTLRDNPAYNIMLQKTANAQTEVFCNLILKKKVMWTEPPDRRAPDEDTISLFMTHRFDLSIYPYDFVSCSDFRSLYTEFCNEHKLPEQTIRDDHMDSLGAPFERKSMYFVSRMADATSPKSYPDEDSSDSSGGANTARVKLLLAKLLAIFVTSSAAREFYAVLGHVSITIAIPLPLLAVGFLFENSARKYELAPGRMFVDNDVHDYDFHSREFSLNTILIGPKPHTLDWATYGAHVQNLVLFYMALTFYAVSFLELVPYLYYSGRYKVEDDAKADVPMEADKPTWTDLMFNAMVFVGRFPYRILLFFFVIGPFGYLGLVAIWTVLAAIINPFKYLPMAAGSLTLIASVTAKLKTLSSLQKKLRERVKRLIKERAAAVLQEIKGAVNSKVDGAKGKISGVLESSAVAAKVGDLVGTLPTDIDGMKRLAKGDIEEIKKLAEKLGLEPLIAQAIVATIRENLDEQKAAIRGLAPRVGLDADLAAALVGVIVTANNKEALQRTMKVLLHEVVRMIKGGKIKLPFNIKAEAEGAAALSTIARDVKSVALQAKDVGEQLKKAPNLDLQAAFAENGVGMASDALEDFVPPELLPMLEAMPSLVESLLAVFRDGDLTPLVDTVMDTEAIAEKLPFPMELLQLCNAALEGQDLRLSWTCMMMMLKMLPSSPGHGAAATDSQGVNSVGGRDDILGMMAEVNGLLQKAGKWGSIDGLGQVLVLAPNLGGKLATFLNTHPPLQMLFVFLGAMTRDEELLQFSLSADNTLIGIDPGVAKALLLLGAGQEGGSNTNPRYAIRSADTKDLKEKLKTVGHDFAVSKKTLTEEEEKGAERGQKESIESDAPTKYAASKKYDGQQWTPNAAGPTDTKGGSQGLPSGWHAPAMAVQGELTVLHGGERILLKEHLSKYRAFGGAFIGARFVIGSPHGDYGYGYAAAISGGAIIGGSKQDDSITVGSGVQALPWKSGDAAAAGSVADIAGISVGDTIFIANADAEAGVESASGSRYLGVVTEIVNTEVDPASMPAGTERDAKFMSRSLLRYDSNGANSDGNIYGTYSVGARVFAKHALPRFVEQYLAGNASGLDVDVGVYSIEGGEGVTGCCDNNPQERAV